MCNSESLCRKDNLGVVIKIELSVVLATLPQHIQIKGYLEDVVAQLEYDDVLHA
jgi:hypothetical protein